jgi:hypothetical protein
MSEPMLGLRVDLTTHEQICGRCERSDGLEVLEVQGMLLTFATPGCRLVHIVVCVGCAAVCALGAFVGNASYCDACYAKCQQSRSLQKHCFCGRYSLAGAEFPATDADGHDVVTAACYKHQHFAGLGRQAISDLQLLS